MKYIKIENAGSLNRKKLELIGLSTKRAKIADSDTIGHKGSGTKLAAIASKRLGLDAAVASTDHIGTYLLTYEVVQEKEGDLTYDRLIFNYGPSHSVDGKAVDVRVPRDLTIDAFEDWDKPIGTDSSKEFKVLREFVCNARDEQKDFGLSVVESRLTVPPDRTAVYLRYTPEIAAMIGPKAARYFKFLAKAGDDRPLYEHPALGAIYPKSDPASTRLFLLGVLVECRNDEGQRSLFDYSMNDKALISEERVLKNYWAYLNEVARMFGQLTDPILIGSILLAVAQNKAPLELEIMSRIRTYSPASRTAWLQGVATLFGEKLCVTSWNETVDRDANQLCGFTVVGRGSMDLQTFFTHLGFPGAITVVPTSENMTYDLVDFGSMDAGSKARFHEAFRLFARQFPERAAFPIIFYLPLDERTKVMAGFCGTGDRKYKEIWVRALGPTLLGSVQDIFETLVHESRHCSTEADDYDRKFLNKAENDLSAVVLRLAGHGAFANGDPIPQAGNILAIKPQIVAPPAPASTPAPVLLPDIPEETTDPLFDLEALLEKISKKDPEK